MGGSGAAAGDRQPGPDRHYGGEQPAGGQPANPGGPAAVTLWGVGNGCLRGLGDDRAHAGARLCADGRGVLTQGRIEPLYAEDIMALTLPAVVEPSTIPDTMRAAVLCGPQDIRLLERPVPQPGP